MDNYFKQNKFYWVNWPKSPTVMSTEDIAQQQKIVQGQISAKGIGCQGSPTPSGRR